MKSAANLFEQMNENSRQRMAMLMGFDYAANELGFCHNLQEIYPLPAGFSLRDAITSYADFLISKFDPCPV